jgi:hypothetical protein
MPEQREQDDDGQRDADQPKQSSTSKTHLTLLMKSATIGLVQPNSSRGAGFPLIEGYLVTLTEPPKQKRRPKPPFDC